MYGISLITGDGIGPEISEAAVSVLEALDAGVSITRVAAGDAALEKTGHALPDETVSAIKESDACLKAPVGETGSDVIVRLRRMLDLYANVRPAKSYPNTPALRDDIDMVIVRENTEDLYVGKEFRVDDAAVALRIISRRASERICRYAFEEARRRNGKKRVTCVHKSNVMKVTDGIFSKACQDVAKDYPDIGLEQMYVDACAMNIIRRPHEFDVIVTGNLFGDILSDESSQAAGGLGMAPAANIGDKFAIFEPVHGAAFDIAGKNIANPTSLILSCKMMLEWLAKTRDDQACLESARRLEGAVLRTVADGARTRDIGGDLGTDEFTQRIIGNL